MYKDVQTVHRITYIHTITFACALCRYVYIYIYTYNIYIIYIYIFGGFHSHGGTPLSLDGFMVQIFISKWTTRSISTKVKDQQGSEAGAKRLDFWRNVASGNQRLQLNIPSGYVKIAIENGH